MPMLGTCRPPFTFQRMCEILLNPAVYRNADKFFAAFSKVRMHDCLVCGMAISRSRIHIQMHLPAFMFSSVSDDHWNTHIL